MNVRMLQDCYVFENEAMRLVLGRNAVAQSLICKATGEECLCLNAKMPLFSVTEDRPFNNEIKLAHPNKRMTFQADRVTLEDDCLIIGFELVPFRAKVRVTDGGAYLAFELVDFIVLPTDYDYLKMATPPVAEFRLLQLPIARRASFGEWLNVMFDDKTAVNVLATSPHARIDAEKQRDCRVMTADAVRGIKLKGCGAALIVTETDKLLDAIEAIENDYDLPKGVKSRRSPIINRSTYWTHDTTPENIDEHLAYVKKAGLTTMLFYYTCLIERNGLAGYGPCGDYNLRKEYPNGLQSLREMLQKVKDAGVTPGIHFLHTHIGIGSSYTTPVADHRLHKTRPFTLAKPIGTDDTVLYVEQNPEGAVLVPECRILQFGGEWIKYESYCTEYPYCFTGCTRGYNNTYVVAHDRGTVGGLVDVSEFGATSVYLDQETDLQDEIADKLAEIYGCGFEFVYFDGSEGTNAPFEFHVPNAQYRTYKKLSPEPLYTEGAAKAHFSWHMLSGGNAFDRFGMDVFKEKLVEFPAEEAPRMAKDFTRLNFGWWTFFAQGQPDMYEFGTSIAAAWNCPGTIVGDLENFKTNARTDDILEVLHRWEDVRAKNWLTDERKKMLQNTAQEHVLLVNENGEYELVPYTHIKQAANGDERVRAFWFERGGQRYTVCWHTSGKGIVQLPIAAEKVAYTNTIGGAAIALQATENGVLLPIEGRRWLKTDLSAEELIKAWENAVVTE